MNPFSSLFGAAAVAATLLGPQQAEAGGLNIGDLLNGDIGETLKDAGKKAAIKAGKGVIDRGAGDLMKGKNPADRYTGDDKPRKKDGGGGHSGQGGRGGTDLIEGQPGDYPFCQVLSRQSPAGEPIKGILQCFGKIGGAWEMDRPVQRSGSVGACTIPARGKEADCDLRPVPLAHNIR